MDSALFPLSSSNSRTAASSGSSSGSTSPPRSILFGPTGVCRDDRERLLLTRAREIRFDGPLLSQAANCWSGESPRRLSSVEQEGCHD